MFLLRKWYVDLTEPNGATAIAYWADLRWGSLTRRGSALFRHGGASPGWRFGVPGAGEPRERDGHLEWDSPETGCTVRVRSESPSFEQRLLVTASGSLRWRVIAPLGSVELQLDDNRMMAAPGYAEMIQLAIPAWQLPIETLRWGRFLSPPHSLVWVSWEGPQPLQIVLRDGVPVPAGTIGDRVVRTSDETLSLQHSVPMAHGDVSEILAPSALRPLINRLTGVWQTRWLSRGVVTDGSGTEREGWAVHEVVRRRSSHE